MTRLCMLAAILFALGGSAQAATRGRGEVGSRVQKARISAWLHTTCAVLDDGTVRCWGANDQGQIGNGTVTTAQSLPAAPTNIGGVVAVAAGESHTCVLLGSGTVKCWGDNNFGQLGNGTTGADSSTAVLVSGLDQVVAIAAGGAHTCAVRVDGTARCWGYNASGQLGNGTFNSSPMPVTVSGLTNAVAIAAGLSHNCALIANGTVRCWGNNVVGQLGDGSNSNRESSVAVSGLSGVVEVAAGRLHTCALLVGGGAQCWGWNGGGQLGDGTTTDKNVPTPVSQLTQAIAIAGGDRHTCALRSDGGMRCWGLNTSGQLGDGTATQRLDAGTAVVGLNNAVAVAAGSKHTCAVDVAGRARCWGANDLGQLGNGAIDPSSIPLTVTGVTGNVGARGIVAGGAFTCARRGNGDVACWGDGRLGQVGNGFTSTFLSNPFPVSGLTDAVALAAGHRHACALRSTGRIACWGDNSQGELGIGFFSTDELAPVAVPGLSGVVAIAAGFEHTCALLHDGTARCWGDNSVGELGANTLNDSPTPVTVTGLNNAVAIVAGGQHTCALVVDGTVRCWGDGVKGELGNGSNSFSRVPVPVTGLNNAVALAAGGTNTCAMLASGGGRCWGDNSFGQLGNSTYQDRNIPDVVSGLSDAVSVTAGSKHTCVVRASGGADCWGHNSDGQLAAADAADHSLPTGVIAAFVKLVPIRLSNIVAMAAGNGGDQRAHTCSLQASGLPRCWGDNSQGQIGDGTTTDAARPTAVPSFTANVAPEVTLKSNGRIAVVTALLNCDVGSHGQIFVSLTQGQVVGYGVASTNCGYGLLEVPLTVPANGPGGFQPGAATAKLEAIVRDNGTITEHLFWTRNVVLAAP